MSATSIVELVVLVVVIVGIVIALFGWDRYRGNRSRASGSAAAQPTSEVFIDPDTGQRTRVWFDSATGKREYRPEDVAPEDKAEGNPGGR